MTGTADDLSEVDISRISILVGFYSTILTAVITLVTFAFAMLAIPLSGGPARHPV